MFCYNCGKEVSDGSQFCPNCGTAIKRSEQSADSAAPAAVAVEAKETPAPEATPAPQAAPAFEAAAPVAETAAKKKSIVPIIIIAVVALIAVIAGVGFLFFRADIAHTFMGDEKYAMSIMDKTIPALSEDNIGKAAVSLPAFDIEEVEKYSEKLSAEYGSEASSYAAIAYFTAYYRNLMDVYAEGEFKNGADFTGKVSLNLSDDFYDMFEELDLDKDEIKEVVEYINGSTFNSSYINSPEAIQFSAMLNGMNGKLAGASVYYDESGKLYISFDELSDKSILFSLPAYGDIEFENSDPEEAQALSTVGKQLYEIYKSFYKDAEIEYGSAEASCGHIGFKGKCVTVKFDEEVLVDMAKEMYKAIDDCDPLSKTVGEEFMTELKELVDALGKFDGKMVLTVKSYVGNNNEVYGTELDFEFEENDTEAEANALYLKGDKGSAVEVSVNGDELIVIKDETENGKNGVITANIIIDKTDNVVTVEYNDVKDVTLYGQETQTGSYRISFESEYLNKNADEEIEIGGDSMKLSELIEESALIFNSSVDGKNVSVLYGLENETFGSVSANLTVVPRSEAGTAVTFDESKVFDMEDENLDDVAGIDFGIELLTSLSEKIEADEKLGEALDLGDVDVADEIENLIDSAEENREAVIEEQEKKAEFLEMDFSGEWTIASMYGEDFETYCERNGMYTWRDGANYIFTDSSVTIELYETAPVTYTYKKGEFTIELYDGSTLIETFSYDMDNDCLINGGFVLETGYTDLEKPEGFIDYGEQGDVLNIYCWNTEFQGLFDRYAADIAEAAGVTVNWIICTNEGGFYQSKLDEALMMQNNASADEKVDLFLIEADYALKYTASPYTMNIYDLGITDDDIANQYEYTLQIATSPDDEIKGLTWQACPGVFAYRRSIAKEVLGTDEPAEVQAQLSDWDSFNEVALKMKERGYTMLAGNDDAYRVFSNNISYPWVNDGVLSIDEGILDWVVQTKYYADNGCNAGADIWSFDWNDEQGPDGKTFGFFYSTWGVNFTLLGNSLATPEADGGVAEYGNGIYGDYAICEGPAPYYWGGSWLCAATGTDNAKLIRDIMIRMTCDTATMKQITLDTQDFTNNSVVMGEIANDPNYGSYFLGGQNHVAIFNEAAHNIDASNMSPYDQLCNEYFPWYMRDYFDGSLTFEDALVNFYVNILEAYPELELE